MYLLLNRLNSKFYKRLINRFMVLAYSAGRWQRGQSTNSVGTGNTTVILFIVGYTDNLIEKHIG
jgi:hypothetical protein